MPADDTGSPVEVTVNEDGVCKIVKGTVLEWLPGGVVFTLTCSILQGRTYPLKLRSVAVDRAQAFGTFEPAGAEIVDIETKITVERVFPDIRNFSRCKVRAKYSGNVRILNHSVAR